MRALRLSLVGTVILVLLGGLGGVVLASSEDAEPTGVVVTQANLALVAEPQMSWVNGDAFGTYEGGS